MTLRALPPGGLPHLSIEVRRPVELAPLRTDIAMFVGFASRGPVGEPVRVEGWRHFESVFGGLSTTSDMGHALKGYFENGGQVAWIVRLAVEATGSSASWKPIEDGGFAPVELGAEELSFQAATPGALGNGLRVRPAYRRAGSGAGLIDLEVFDQGIRVERHVGVDPGRLGTALAEDSALLRCEPVSGSPAIPGIAGDGPRTRSWDAIDLAGGDDGRAPNRGDYAALLPNLADAPEPALLVFPDLQRHLGEEDAATVILGAARLCDPGLERMVVADAPEQLETATDGQAWIDRFGSDPAVHRTVVTYHPWIEMRDPVGTAAAPLRRLTPTGHVAGVISRLDRTRGTYVTPANTTLRDTIDLSRRIEREDQDALSEAGINALRCQSARGIVVWGGRMLRTTETEVRYVAHRRLIHRLVRALRRTWAPMVFESNDDALRLAVARSATTLLMEAFHANVLKGTRPDEAFRVVVDDTVNTPASIEAGRLVCEIAIAPAIPMEFIHFRVGLSADGTVEFLQS